MNYTPIKSKIYELHTDYGLGLRVEGLGFRIEGLWFRVRAEG